MINDQADLNSSHKNPEEKCIHMSQKIHCWSQSKSVFNLKSGHRLWIIMRLKASVGAVVNVLIVTVL